MATPAAALTAEAVLLVAGSAGEALAVAVSTALVVSVEDISPVAVFVAAVSVGATGTVTGAITDFPMLSSSVATAIRGGGTIHTATTITTTTRTGTMDTADTRIMDTADTVTTMVAVTDIAIAVAQGISGVFGGADNS